MLVEIVKAELPRDTVKLVKSWWPIYANDPHWVPPVIMERKDFFNPNKNPYFKFADIQVFYAKQDGTIVGTIAATVDKSMQKSEPGVGLFGFFEFIDDEAVARALFDAAAGWLKERGIALMRGPYNFSPNHEFGLRIDDNVTTDPAISNPHNAHYYPAMYEKLGLFKAMDWFAYWLKNEGGCPPKIERIANRFLERNEDVTMRKADMKNFDREVKLFREIYNDAWVANWGHAHFEEEEFYFMSEGLKQVINPDLCWFIYKGDEVVGASLTLPDFNQVAKKMNGSVFPFGWYHFMFGKKKIDAIRVFVLGIKKKYQRQPFGAPLYLKTWEEGQKLNIRGADCSLILETNNRMRGALEKLGATIYQTYRTYEFELEEGGKAKVEAATVHPEE